ncbi:MAG: FtsX-like permease family protein, partial [Spirochaetaceae bacterium]|nr:FtsX-like permease family protein [Spirochaetaceae bacterium]
VAAAEPIVSGAALLAGPGGHELKTAAFGVEGGYFALFPRLKFLSGAAPEAGERAWIVLPRSRAEEFEKAEGRKLAIGDSLQLTMATKGAFAIRAAVLKGIVESPSRGGEEGAPVYVDPTTLRSLLGLALGNAPTAAEAAGEAEAVDLASFFDAPAESAAGTTDEAPAGLEYAARLLASGSAEPERYDVEKGAWHFVLARLEPGTSATLALAAANASLRKAGMAAEAVDWLSIAGMNASVLFLLKTVFEIGIAILAAVVILVLSNGLAFSVIEQTKEIGTMRAIGAQTAFVRKLFFLQALALCLAGTAFGVLLARLALAGVGAAGIPISNDYLVMLFGTSVLKPALSAGAALASLAGAGAVAAISSVYPMYLATRTSVAQTMGAE